MSECICTPTVDGGHRWACPMSRNLPAAPTTEAGREMHATWHEEHEPLATGRPMRPCGTLGCGFSGRLVAIEQEARASLLARLREEVAGLRDGVGTIAWEDAQTEHDIRSHSRYDPAVRMRNAVLAILEVAEQATDEGER